MNSQKSKTKCSYLHQLQEKETDEQDAIYEHQTRKRTPPDLRLLAKQVKQKCKRQENEEENFHDYSHVATKGEQPATRN